MRSAARTAGGGCARAARGPGRCARPATPSWRRPAPTSPVRCAGPGFPPLDERLGLLAGSPLTPRLAESLIRLGASLPSAQAAELLAHFTGVRADPDTVRRPTERAGAAQVAIEAAAVAELERTLPDAPPGPAVQLLSVDGAMAPLVGGVWAEVKTLVLGEVVPGPRGPVTAALSYCSRLTDAETFGRLATAEPHRRGTASARTVVAVADGATWCQGFVDLHRPDAVRVLDFPHAVEHLGAAAQAAFGPGTPATSARLGERAHALRHGAEEAVLAALAALAATPRLGAEAAAAVRGVRAYLASRRGRIRYRTFAAAGYPIGGGSVESANKLVVEARLKGAGMHWARANVDPMLALRTPQANGRRDREWPALWRQVRHSRRRRPRPRIATPPPVASVPTPMPRTTPRAAAPRPKLVVDGKPTIDHPWKRGLALQAKP